MPQVPSGMASRERSFPPADLRSSFLIKLQDMDRVGGRWHLLPGGGARFSCAVTAWGDLAYSQRGTWCWQPRGDL